MLTDIICIKKNVKRIIEYFLKTCYNSSIMLIHNILFYELAFMGFPEVIHGLKIEYYYPEKEIEILGFNGKTELKIKVMMRLWEVLKKNKNNFVKSF